MTQLELHAVLLDVVEWLNAHLHALEDEFPKDDEGFAILPKNAVDGDALRVLQDVSSRVTRILFRIGNERIEGDDELPEQW